MGKYKNIVLTSTGIFKEKQKEQQDGYTAEAWEMADGRKGTTYVKTHVNLKGVLKKIELVSPPYNENLLELRLFIEENADTTYTLSIPYLDSKGQWLSDWITAIAPVLGGLKQGMRIETWLNRNKKDKSDKLYKNIFFKNADTDEMIKPTFQNTDIPRWKSEVFKHPVTRVEKTIYHRDENNSFIVDKIEKALVEFNNSTVEKPSTKVEQPKSKEVALPEEDDDLPF
jgi:hypothetical protein